jgi:2-polyprenyl-3-methyl-5-hydroxy-6-metoxy-1,4-benzoquinol methylase
VLLEVRVRLTTPSYRSPRFLDVDARREIVNELTQAKYILGHSQEEIRRLICQAAILRPFTERLLRNAEIGPGMRVLDLGCGAGDVSMLAAELVGPSGSVVGIDRNPQVIALAGARARTAGLEQVTFKEVALDGFSDLDLFDCVIGRYVLVRQANPTDFLRSAACHVRSASPSTRSTLPEVSILDPASGAGTRQET